MKKKEYVRNRALEKQSYVCLPIQTPWKVYNKCCIADKPIINGKNTGDLLMDLRFFLVYKIILKYIRIVISYMFISAFP